MKTTTGIKSEDAYFSTNEICKLTGLTFPTVQKRLERLKPVEGSHGSHLYCLPEAIPFLFPKMDESMAELKLQREREETRLAAARAAKVEFDNAERNRTLVPFDEAERRYAELVVNFKQRLLAIPTKAAFEVIQMKEPQKAEDYLKTHIAEAIHELTRRPRLQNSRSRETSTEYDNQSMGR